MLAPIGALVLAGGFGRRVAPHDKLLARDATGRSMIACTLQALEGSRLDRVVLVLGHRAADVLHAAREVRPNIHSVVATDHAEGMAASLRRGIGEARLQGWQAAMVCLGDMPYIGPALINRLIDTYCNASAKPDAVAPLLAGRHGHPVLWDESRFDALLALRGDGGGRGILDDRATQLLTVDAGDPATQQDFDTPDRLAAFIAGKR